MTTNTSTDLGTFSGTWTLDPTKTTVTFRTKAMWGILKVKGSFTATEGTGTVGEDGTVSGTLVLDAASVDTGNKKRDDHLRTDDFFDVGTYPTITFSATGAAPQSSGKVQVTGDLTVLGNTRPLTLLVDVAADGTAATVTTETDVDRSQWGVSWAKMGAGIANHVVVEARFVKA